MLAADAVVLASHKEASGGRFSLTEAREAGCAIVASVVDGVSEPLDGGNASLLVPPRDTSALEAALTRTLSDPREKPT